MNDDTNPKDDVTFETTEEGKKVAAKKAAEEASADEDFVMEEDAETEQNPAAAMKKLRDRLKKVVEEKQEYLTGWQKDKAEFLNIRKRDEERQKEIVKYANEELILDLLPVLDSFEMAKANKEAWEKVDKNWRSGIEYIQSQILNILQKNNLTEINPLGQDYDPLQHEAIELVEVKDMAEDGKVIAVINKGYNLNGKVVRAPKVKVGEVKK